MVIVDTHRPPIIKPNIAVINPPILKLILLGIKLAKSYAGGTKFATMFIPTVAAKNAKKSEDANFIELFGNYMFTFLVNTFFGSHYTDGLDGFLIIKRDIFKKLKTVCEPMGIEQEISIRIAKKGYSIAEIESWEPKRIGGRRKMRPLTTGALLSYQIIKEFIFWKFH